MQFTLHCVSVEKGVEEGPREEDRGEAPEIPTLISCISSWGWGFFVCLFNFFFFFFLTM